MTDPHVVALLYRIHGEAVDYRKASPLIFEEASFRPEVKNCHARFELKEHYATEKEARNAIENYISEHKKVNHGEGQYAVNGSHVNSIEGHWSLFKRSVRGTHVHISRKHTPKYLAEFDFRHNLRSMPDRLFHVLMLLVYQGTPVGAKR